MIHDPDTRFSIPQPVYLNQYSSAYFLMSPAVLALWGKRLAAYRARQTAKRRTRKHITRRKVNAVAKPSPQLLTDQSDRIAEE